MIFLECVAGSVMMLARPTSEPVPAVVGTATIGRIALASARVHQSPISSKSQIGRVCPAMKAMALPTSRPEPPPKAMTPSCPPALSIATPASTLVAGGLGFTSEKNPASMPASASILRALVVTGRFARPVSVTNNGFVIPTAFNASGNSAMRPAPKRTAVG